MWKRATSYLERLCWLAAVLCLLPYALTTGGRAWYASIAADESSADESSVTVEASPAEAERPPPLDAPVADAGIAKDALWAPQRVKAFLRYKANADLPVAAVLRLPAQDREIPVFAGISEATMTLGAGHLEDTSPLDGSGNIALSAHRDGSFRILKDVQRGDPLVLSVGGEDRLFRVSRQRIVEPEAVSVLDATDRTTLTLITCYPIYFIGNAPQRYIVQAELVADSAATPEPDRTRRSARTGQQLSIADKMRRNDL